MKKNLLVLLLSYICMMTVAAPVVGKATLSGQVSDAIDGSPLTGVVVTFPELNIGATTNEKRILFI